MWEKYCKMHKATNKIKSYRKNSMSIKNLNPLLKSIKFKSKKFTKFRKILKDKFKRYKNEMAKKITQWNYSWRFIY
jgi:homoserine kinase type II